MSVATFVRMIVGKNEWSDTEWHEPTVEYLFVEESK